MGGEVLAKGAALEAERVVDLPLWIAEERMGRSHPGAEARGQAGIGHRDERDVRIRKGVTQNGDLLAAEKAAQMPEEHEGDRAFRSETVERNVRSIVPEDTELGDLHRPDFTEKTLSSGRRVALGGHSRAGFLAHAGEDALGAVGLPKFGERLLFDLPDALAGDAQSARHFFQGVRTIVGEAVAKPDDGAFPA